MLQLDLCDSSSIPDKCDEAIALFGHIDVLINNAGVSSRGSVLESSMDVDRKIMEVNFFGTVAFTKGTPTYPMHTVHLQSLSIMSEFSTYTPHHPTPSPTPLYVDITLIRRSSRTHAGPWQWTYRSH